MNAIETIDPHLQAVIRAAESGADLYRVVVVCGPTVYVGKPVSKSTFGNTNFKELGVEFFKDAGNWNTSRQEKEAIANRKATAILEAMAPGDTASTLDVLSLSPAQVFPGGLTSYEVPAVRVHLRQVDSWWVAPFVANQAKFQGGGVGVSF